MKGVSRWDRVKYTWRHKMAYLRLEKAATGRNTLSGYLHDIDKLFTYWILPDKTVQKIHRKISKHHTEYIFGRTDYRQMVIDCECARETKPDKQLNAFETFKEYYRYHIQFAIGYMMEFNFIDVDEIMEYWRNAKEWNRK